MIKRSNIWMLIEGVINSYGQVFFSLDKAFGLILMLCSFFDPMLGLMGLVAVVSSNLFAHMLGFSKEHIREGIYGFNSLLLGMALGFDYKPSWLLFVFIVLAVFIALINQVWIGSILSKYNLPSLSLPFLLTVWIMILALRQTSLLEFAERGVYKFNEALLMKQQWFYSLEAKAEGFSFPGLVAAYFKSMGGVFFQGNLVAGIMITAGLLYHSRIAFTLTVMAFAWAWLCISFAGTEMEWMKYQAGANFIFLAIAVGCFFVVPSIYSYLAVLALVPVTIVVQLFFMRIFNTYHLPVYTLSFSFVTIAFIQLLRARQHHRHLDLVAIQYYSPEKTIYKSVNSAARHKFSLFKQFQLPFWGEWFVSQGYDGKHTHLRQWSKAFDFVILDTEMKQYHGEGTHKENYYCFNKPVVAPAAGVVANIAEYIEDNDVAAMNLQRNWGNSIVIDHGHGLYCQLSHLKKESIKVRIGEYVNKGDIIAACGNSGRSPEPHIHFQLQLKPDIGAPTYEYPLAYYLLNKNGKQELKTFEKPEEGDFVSNIVTTPLMAKAFGLYPGMKFTYRVSRGNHKEDNHWEVFTDAYNRTYIYCHTTQSYAYFVNDGTLFYFTDFEGEHNSALYAFYLAAYKVLLGYNPGITVEDGYPLTEFNNPLAMAVQDFIAPFYRFVKADYSVKHSYTDNIHHPNTIELQAWATVKFIGKPFRQNEFRLVIENERVQRIEIVTGKDKLTAECV